MVCYTAVLVLLVLVDKLHLKRRCKILTEIRNIFCNT